MHLAMYGAKSVRTKPWPKWPQGSNEILERFEEVLRSERWSVRGRWSGILSKTEIFEKDFAVFNRVPYCITTSSGSSALVIALEALDIGAGDEVIVPAQSWVATAAAVLNVNAIPIFADVDSETGCISPDAIKNRISPKTRAIIPIHQYCRMADMDQIKEISIGKGIPVIEDCAQACGSMWNGKYAGAIGEMGVFSMNQEKVLPCGEGGAIITHDKKLYERIVQLRTEGEKYSNESYTKGDWVFTYGDLMGTNYCLTEFQAAILIEKLADLEKENRKREQNARVLESNLREIEGLTILEKPRNLEKTTYQEFAVRCNGNFFSCKSLSQICEAITREIGFPVYEADPPVLRNPLFLPETKRRYNVKWLQEAMALQKKNDFPGAEAISNEYILFHHRALLGNNADMNDIYLAFKKVAKYAEEIGCSTK